MTPAVPNHQANHSPTPHSTSTKPYILEVSGVSKSFRVAEAEVPILKNVSVKIETGAFVIIIGPSGCGKSTLLHTLLGLEPPSQGKVTFLGKDLYSLPDEDARADFRKRHAGMVYQQANWIKSLTVVENVALPLQLLGVHKTDALKKALEMLGLVEIEAWADYVPSELSSGQQQRVSLARSLITNPDLIVADEPTGNLDYDSGQDLMRLLTRFNQAGKTILMVTHDLEYLHFAQKAVKMFDGQIVGIFDQNPSQAGENHGKRGLGLGRLDGLKE